MLTRREKIPQQIVRRQIILNSREETMKMPLVVALVGLAISFASPSFAQQKEATLCERDCQQIDALAKKYDEADNNSGAAALAALFTEDAVIVPDTGPVNGRPAIEKWYADAFQQWHNSSHLIKADQNSPHSMGTAGNEAWSNGEWSVTIRGQSGDPIQLKGYWSVIDTREGDDWKIRMLTWNTTPAPAPPVATAETK
jgi:ketosteroid isomerase-like protein